MINHLYKLFISKWFISIRFYGDVYDYDEYRDKQELVDNENIIQINDGVYAHFAPEPNVNVGSGNSYNQMHPDNYQYLIRGLEKVSRKIKNNSVYNNTVVVITRVEHNHCDYQDEGLTAGIMEWAAKAFDFECPKTDVSFDGQKNKYIYDFMK